MTPVMPSHHVAEAELHRRRTLRLQLQLPTAQPALFAAPQPPVQS